MLYMPVYIVSIKMFYRGCTNITDASPVYNISITVLYMCYTPVDNIPFFTVYTITYMVSVCLTHYLKPYIKVLIYYRLYQAFLYSISHWNYHLIFLFFHSAMQGNFDQFLAVITGHATVYCII